MSPFPALLLAMKFNLRLLLAGAATVAGSLFPPSATTEIKVGPNYPTDYFSSPLDIPLVLSGTFAELRPNHFHGGIDIKTDEVKNIPVYAVADGYVSRINISSTGYGNALYIAHPNGYTSVYAHLDSFSPDIARWIKNKQYEKQTWAIDEYLPEGLLPVKKRQQIARSGNTGSSESPHLHFEIRDSQTEVTINPLLFGFKVNDKIRPILQSVYLYNMTDPDRYFLQRKYNLKNNGIGNYVIGDGKGSINLLSVGTTQMGIGIKCYDQTSDAYNKNGVYSITAYNNGTIFYSHTMEKVGFDETRCINSHTDYKEQRDGNGFAEKCFVDPGNHLQIYQQLNNQGIVDLADGQMHKITLEVRDAIGNLSTLNFMLQYKPENTYTLPASEPYAAYFQYNTPNIYTADKFKIDMPTGVLYNNLYFKFAVNPPQSNKIYSNVFKVHDRYTPANTYFNIALQPNNLPDSLRNKAVVAYIWGTKQKSLVGTWDGDYLKARTREFGNYYITTDIIAPKITPINITPGRNMQNSKSLWLNTSDDLSGIKSYKGYIDDQWVLFSYEEKSGKLEYLFDEHVPAGKHHLRLEVSDQANNIRTYEADFIR